MVGKGGSIKGRKAHPVVHCSCTGSKIYTRFSVADGKIMKQERDNETEKKPTQIRRAVTKVV